MQNRRQFLRTAGAAFGASQLRAQKRPPNIILILADDLGYSDVGCYGQDKIRTPNIDRLAREGMRFTDAYSGCTVCAPSRSVLMTGLHGGHTPIRTNGMGSLRADELTIVELLKKSGYATGGFGKWGLGEEPGQPGVPTRKGFDKFFGYLNQAHAHFFYPEYLYDNERKYPLEGNTGGKRTTYSHDVIAEKALEFIRANSSRHFFCYLPFTIPHWELLVPEDSISEYRGKFEEVPFIDANNHYARQDESHAAYAGMVTRMDRDIGRVMALLKEQNIDDNTIVFFTSDNGPALPIRGDDYFKSKGQFRGHKNNMYEGGIRVPMIARWPKRIEAGKVSNFMWGFQDFFPTFAELAGAKTPDGLDGISVVPTLLGEKAAGRAQRPHEYMYWELPRRDPKNPWHYSKEAPMQALRQGDWKVVRPKPDAPVELYNLAADIGEKHDLAAQKPDVLARMEALLKSARTVPRPAIPFKDSWRKQRA